VHFHSAVVVNEAQLHEFIQKETNAGARGADSFEKALGVEPRGFFARHH